MFKKVSPSGEYWMRKTANKTVKNKLVLIMVTKKETMKKKMKNLPMKRNSATIESILKKTSKVRKKQENNKTILKTIRQKKNQPPTLRG